MRNFQEKKTARNIIQTWPFLLLFSGILIFFAWGVIRFLVKLEETSNNRDIAELKVSELNKNKTKLVSDIESLQTDKGLEENIRQKFGLAKEGEGLIVVVDDKSKIDANAVEKKNWFMSLFTGWFK